LPKGLNPKSSERVDFNGTAIFQQLISRLNHCELEVLEKQMLEIAAQGDPEKFAEFQKQTEAGAVVIRCRVTGA
jgi:hypothetical protein